MVRTLKGGGNRIEVRRKSWGKRRLRREEGRRKKR